MSIEQEFNVFVCVYVYFCFLVNVYVGNATGLVCNNETVKVECDNTTQTKLYPNVCCNFGAGAVCCKEIP